MVQHRVLQTPRMVRGCQREECTLTTCVFEDRWARHDISLSTSPQRTDVDPGSSSSIAASREPVDEQSGATFPDIRNMWECRAQRSIGSTRRP